MKWPSLALTLGLTLAACGSTAAPSAAPVSSSPAPASAASRPASASAAPASAAAPAASASAAASAAAPKPSAASAASNAGLLPVKIGLLGSNTDAGFYIGMEKSFFKEEGLALDVVSNFTSGEAMVAPLSAGQLDVGGGAASAGLYNAAGRGIPIIIVADKGRLSPQPTFDYASVVARTEVLPKLKGYADLKGLHVGVNARKAADGVVLYQMLKQGGLTEKDVDVTELPFPQMNLALANRSLDVAITSEPYISAGVKDGIYGVWKSQQEVYPGQQKAMVMYSPKFAQSQPDAAKRFMVAYLKGIRAYNDAFVKNKNRDEIVDIMVKYTAVKDRALYSTMKPPGLDPNGKVSLKSLQDDEDWYVSQGYTTAKVELDKLFDGQYVDYAIQKLGTYQ